MSLALHAAFPDAKIHGGNVQQGLSPGDFNVILSRAGHQLGVGRWFKRTATVDVIYYPRKDNAECYDIADKLTAVLVSITTPEGDVVHATNCTWNVTEGALHVLVAYDHHVYKTREDINMATLRIDQRG